MPRTITFTGQTDLAFYRCMSTLQGWTVELDGRRCNIVVVFNGRAVVQWIESRNGMTTHTPGLVRLSAVTNVVIP